MLLHELLNVREMFFLLVGARKVNCAKHLHLQYVTWDECGINN